MTEKPTAAFVLSLIGAILILVSSIFILLLGGVVAAIAMPGMGRFMGRLFMVFGIAGLVLGAAAIYGAMLINSGVPSKVKTGSIVVLFCSVVSLITGGGFIIGFILGLIGGILGLTWSPKTQQMSPTPQLT